MDQRHGSPSPLPQACRTAAGFTLIELLVSLAVTAVLILGVLATFDFSARMNRVQMNVADMQQSLRIAQNEVVKLSRMTGRGSLPVNTAIQVTNNVTAGTRLVPTEAATLIQEGTDVVRLRGVFTSALYQVEFMNPLMWNAPNGDGEGSVVVQPLAAGVPQDFSALLAAAKENEDESLLLVTPFDTYAVAKIRGDLVVEGANLRINFTRHPNEAALAGPLSAGMPSAAHVGILEEYAFYVRQNGGGNSSPTLAKARLEPGSNLPYKDNEANVTLDVADNILDLQAALGFGVAGAPELRVTILARTDRRDPGQYLAPLLPATIEDHAYPVNHAFNADDQRRFRWRLMRTDVNLRNL
jgi:prepilin-type N-terminal cleavage/methylation domain-containing protein